MTAFWPLYPKLPNPKFFLPLAILITLIAMLILMCCQLANAAEWTDAEIVSAIYKAEGGAKAAYPYGIRSIKTSNPRQVCFNTVRNNRKRYADYGYKQYATFLEFLASRYCPTTGNLSKAERRLNKNWLKNVRYFLAKGAGK